MNNKQKEKDNGSFLTGIWKRKFFIIIVTVLTFLVSMIASAIAYGNTGRGFVSLNYEEASQGLNPNGTRFNIYEMESDEVLSELIDIMNLNDELTCDELRDMIVLNPANTKSVDERYIATGYEVTVNPDKKLPDGITAQNITDVLLSVYNKYFIDHYGIKTNILNISWDSTDDLDYLEFAEVAESKVEGLTSYLQEMIDQSGMTQYQMTGETFSSLKESASNFADIYIDKYKAFVQQNNLFADKVTYYNKLVYKQLLTKMEYDQENADYEIRIKAIDNYDESMITFVMVPMYDDSNWLYMARTEIGPDTLAQEADDFSQDAKESSAKLDEIEREMKSTQEADIDASDYEKADDLIQTIMTELDGLAARINTVSSAYASYRSKNDIKCSSVQYSISNIYKIKRSAIISAAVLVILCAFFILYDSKRRGISK